ncbi:hypothetical protein ACJX0J_027134, partial [Zea mays]
MQRNKLEQPIWVVASNKQFQCPKAPHFYSLPHLLEHTLVASTKNWIVLQHYSKRKMNVSKEDFMFIQQVINLQKIIVQAHNKFIFHRDDIEVVAVDDPFVDAKLHEYVQHKELKSINLYFMSQHFYLNVCVFVCPLIHGLNISAIGGRGIFCCMIYSAQRRTLQHSLVSSTGQLILIVGLRFERNL